MRSSRVQVPGWLSKKKGDVEFAHPQSQLMRELFLCRHPRCGWRAESVVVGVAISRWLTGTWADEHTNQRPQDSQRGATAGEYRTQSTETSMSTAPKRINSPCALPCSDLWPPRAERARSSRKSSDGQIYIQKYLLELQTHKIYACSIRSITRIVSKSSLY